MVKAPNQQQLIFCSVQADPPLLTCSLRHGLSSGDLVCVAGREFQVRSVSDTQFYALAVKDDEDDSPEADATSADLGGQTVFLLERALDFDAEFVSLTVKLGLMRTCSGLALL